MYLCNFNNHHAVFAAPERVVTSVTIKDSKWTPP